MALTYVMEHNDWTMILFIEIQNIFSWMFLSLLFLWYDWARTVVQVSDADNEPLVNDTKTSLDFDEQLTKFLNWYYFLPLQAMAAACATSSCQGHCTPLSQGGIFCDTSGKLANSSLIYRVWYRMWISLSPEGAHRERWHGELFALWCR